MDLVLRLHIPPQNLRRHELRCEFPPPPSPPPRRFHHGYQIGSEGLETEATGEAKDGEVREALGSLKHGGLVGDRRGGDEEEG